MKVSVIIPFFRDREYIGDCLESVVGQSYGHWECILVDDCGGDGSAAAVHNFCGRDSRFRVLEHNENQGQGAARNTAMRVAGGDYFYFMDADDRFVDEFSLQTLVERAVKEGADWVQGSYLRSNGNVASYGDLMVCRDEIDGEFERLNFTNAAGKLVSKEFIERNELYFAEGLIYEDLEWNLRAYGCVRKISNVEKCCYYHNLRDNSIMRSDFNERKVESAVVIIEKFLELSTKDKNIANVLLYKALFVLKNLLMGNFSSTYKYEQFKRLKTILKIKPNYKKLPPFTKLLARFRGSYMMSNLLCKVYQWSR